MSADRIDQLHEQASERYLNRDYDAAMAAWRELLELDPGNEQALEGVRMCAVLSDRGDAEVTLGAEAPPEPQDDFESEIEKGLALFNSLSPAGKAASASATQAIDRSEIDAMLRRPIPPGPAGPFVGDLDPKRQGDGIDFGDGDDVAPIPLSTADTDEVGLDPSLDAHGTANAGDGRALPPQHVLLERIAELLTEARARRDAGDRPAALAVIARIYVLDDSQPEARELEAELRESAAADLTAIEDWMTEGVQAFDQDRLDDARGFFSKVLEVVPDHREAVHYLEAIEERSSGAVPMPADLFGGSDMLDDVPLDLAPAGDAPAAPAPAERPARPAPPVMQTLPARRRFSMPRWALPAVLGLAAVALGIVFLPGLIGGGAGEDATPEVIDRGPTRDPGRAARPRRAAPVAEPAPVTAAPAPLAPLDEALRSARLAMSGGDYGKAVLAFNDAISLDPQNAEAIEGIARAGELYKAKKAEQEQLDRVRMAFRDGEYASALRVLYRLPDTIDRARVERWKVDGWFNLGLVALRAGEAPQALTHFEEALAILPDPEASKWKAFAERNRNLPKNRVYYDAVESIPFRKLD